jgi:predicted GNAT superfamily acetyltransferase
MIVYREIHDAEELKQVVTLETVVWGMTAADAVPHNMMMAVIHSGGLVNGAYDENGEMVGFGLCQPMRHGNQWGLWSHMAGVHPRLQGKGIGFGIKQHQRKWALAHDYQLICWTFDPLQRGNANFNLRILKGVTNMHHTNLYGAMTDGINAGMESDRLEIAWRLDDPVVSAAAEGNTIEPATNVYPREDFLLWSDADGLPQLRDPLTVGAAYHFAEIPKNLAALKQNSIAQAKDWQIKLRTALQYAFGQGYVAVDFADDGSRCWYVLRRG